MSILRYPVNIPNPGKTAVTVNLHLQKANPRILKELGFAVSSRELEVASAAIVKDPCAVTGKRELSFRLKGLSSRTVFVVVETKPGRENAAAVFHLVDTRGDQKGGTLIACFNKPQPEIPGQLVKGKNPCLLELAKPAYLMPTGSDPSKIYLHATLAEGLNWELVVPVINPGKEAKHGVTIYLEHLGSGNYHFAPATWHVGRLDAGEIFYATWQVTLDPLSSLPLTASVVAASAGTIPVRLDCVVRVDKKSKKPIVKIN